MTTVTALTPKEVAAKREESRPAVVVEVFNEMLVDAFSGFQAVIYEKDVVAKLVERGLTREDIYRFDWLEIQKLYRAKGWEVVRDRPGYNECYDTYFRFRKKS